MAERTRDSDGPHIEPELHDMHGPDWLSAVLRRAGWQIAGHDPGVYRRFKPPPGPGLREFELLVPLNPAAPEFDETMQYALDVLFTYTRLGEGLTAAAAAERRERTEDRYPDGNGYQAGHRVVDSPMATARPCRYEVPCWPGPGSGNGAVYVERGQNHGWCVTDGIEPAVFLSRDGTWAARGDYADIGAFRAAHFFPLDQAMALAEEYASRRPVGGTTAASRLEIRAERSDRPAARPGPDVDGKGLPNMAEEALGRTLHAGPSMGEQDDATPSTTAGPRAPLPPPYHGPGRYGPERL